MKDLIDQFKDVYKSLNKDSITSIESIYAPDIVFEDPFHVVHGLDSLKQYFSKMYENVIECKFDFNEVIVDDNKAALFWIMHLSHRKLNNRNIISVPGSTLIHSTSKVTYHRDYFDAGALLYEQVPLLSRIIKLIKGRI